MDQQDVTYYFTSETAPPVDTVKRIIESCEAVDFHGSNEKQFYNGLEGFAEGIEYDFEIKPQVALEKAEAYRHANFTLLEWQKDELLIEICDLLEEITEKSKLKVDSISLLSGKHEILSLADKSIVTAEFSLAFYFETPLLEDPADLNLRASKDKDLKEKVAMLEDICKCRFKSFFGGS